MMIFRNLSCLVLLLIIFTSTEAAEPEEAREILAKGGVKGGVLVHVGCGDGKLTAALHDGEPFLVHGLDADPANVNKTLEYAKEMGLGGVVSASRYNGKHLPFINNVVNLVVLEDKSAVTREELMRILVPSGVACIHGILGTGS